MHAPPDLIVRGLALDSRKVEEGFLFFALPGEKEDGGEFIAEAKARGAAIVGIFHDEGVRRQVADRLHSMGMAA